MNQVFYILLFAVYASCTSNPIHITITELQQPTLHNITLACQQTSPINFTVSLPSSSVTNTTPLMLRLDYQQNRCISAPQDILLQPTSSLPTQISVSVQFNKTCCNIFTKQTHETVRIITTVRHAYVLFGFPISKAFSDAVLPIVVGVAVAVILWVWVDREEEWGQDWGRSGQSDGQMAIGREGTKKQD